MNTAEIYDPVSGTFASTGNMTAAHSKHTATLLANGQVLIAAGGPTLKVAELYDPSSGAFTATGSLNYERFGQVASLLSNGLVLVAGGFASSTSVANQTAELYTPPSMPAAKIMSPINGAVVAGTVDISPPSARRSCGSTSM